MCQRDDLNPDCEKSKVNISNAMRKWMIHTFSSSFLPTNLSFQVRVAVLPVFYYFLKSPSWCRSKLKNTSMWPLYSSVWKSNQVACRRDLCEIPQQAEKINV